VGHSYVEDVDQDNHIEEGPAAMMPSRVDSAKPEIEKLLQRMTQQLRDALPAGSFEERERAALALCNEVARRTFQRELQDIADGFAPA
jgi:hypothetical protein